MIVNSLWTGEFSNESMISLMKFGGEVHLWHYVSVTKCFPSNVVLKDANEILPLEKSRAFRYELLYLFGGWWVESHVKCLKPLQEIDSKYLFLNPKSGSVIKVPAKSEIMSLCSETTKNGRIDSLSYFIDHLGLSKYVCKKDLFSIVRIF